MSVEVDQVKRVEGTEKRLHNRNMWRVKLEKSPFANGAEMIAYEDKLREQSAPQK